MALIFGVINASQIDALIQAGYNVSVQGPANGGFRIMLEVEADPIDLLVPALCPKCWALMRRTIVEDDVMEYICPACGVGIVMSTFQATEIAINEAG